LLANITSGILSGLVVHSALRQECEKTRNVAGDHFELANDETDKSENFEFCWN
jgi:hypothetical protein